MNKREIVEANFIFSLWKEPHLYHDFIYLTKNDFMTDMGWFYYSVGKDMFNSRFSEFDEVSLSTYFSDKKESRELYEEYGGFSTVKELKTIVNTENIDGYYDEFTKGNVIKNLIDLGMLNDLSKIKDMNTEQIYDYYESTINDVFIKSTTSLKIEDLVMNDYDLQMLDAGAEMGYSFYKYAPSLNYHMMGIPKGELVLISAKTGAGKTTFTASMLLYPLAESGIKCCMMSNEQTIIKIKTMMLCMILFREINHYKITRKRLRQGKFNEEEWKYLGEAKNKMKDLFLGKLKFVEMYDYSSSKIKKVIRQMSAQGFEIFFFDTFKSDTTKNSSDPSWYRLLNDSKDIHQLCKNLGVSLILSMQNDQNKNNRTVMESDMLGESKKVYEVVAEGLMLRKLDKEEYTDEKFDCGVFKYKRDAKSHKIIKDSGGRPIKEFITLEKDKTYIVVFHTKTRSDEVGTQIIYESVGAFGCFKELGYANIVDRKRF